MVRRFVDGFQAAIPLLFLKQLVPHRDGTKIHMTPDGVPHPKAPNLRERLEGKEDLIELHLCPPIPRDATVEYGWRTTDQMAAHTAFFAGLEDLRNDPAWRLSWYQANPASLTRSLVRNVRL
jgi:hypothetical protein